MANLSPGREHDLRELKLKLDQAKTPQERNKWRSKISQIMREGENPTVVHMRGQLIQAMRDGKTEKANSITEALYRETR